MSRGLARGGLEAQRFGGMYPLVILDARRIYLVDTTATEEKARMRTNLLKKGFADTSRGETTSFAVLPFTAFWRPSLSQR